MATYVISFPSAGMSLTHEELAIASAGSQTVIEDAKTAGVFVAGGGINEEGDPVLVPADGAAPAETPPDSDIIGGFTVVEVPTRDDAVEWANKMTDACRCAQELREFSYNPDR